MIEDRGQKIVNGQRSTVNRLWIRVALCAVLGTGCWVLGTNISHAAERRFEAGLEESATSVGQPVYLNLAFYGAQDVDRPDVEPVDGLQIKYVGPSTRISVVNGRVSQSVTHNYLIMPLREGDYEIGPFRAVVDGEVYVAAPVRLAVMGGGSYAPASASPAPSRAPQAPSAPMPSGQDAPPRKAYESDRIFLAMDVPKNKVYVNEIMPLTVKLYGTAVSLKDIEYPMYAHDGFSAGDFPEPEKGREFYRGLDYNTLVFKQDIFAIKEGKYTLGPAKLNCTMLIRRERPRRASAFGRSIFDDDFFGSVLRGYQEYPIELSTDPIEMTILPLPEEGKPADFQGAVGDFNFDVQTDIKKVRVGDPITVKMMITGNGNFDTVTAPLMQESEDFKVYEPQVSRKGNRKVYDQVVIPKNDKVKEIPAVSFSFFSPRYEAYKTVAKGPVPIEVQPRPEGEAPVKMVTASAGPAEKSVYAEEKLGKDIIYIKENLGGLAPAGKYLFNDWFFWAVQFMPAGLFLALFFSHRKSEKIRTDKKYARFLKAPRKARLGISGAKALIGGKKPVEFYDVIFRTIQEYIGDKFNLPKGAVTSQVIDERLRPAGYDEHMLGMLKDIFDACEMARYASLIPDAAKEEEILDKMRQVIDYLEKARV